MKLYCIVAQSAKAQNKESFQFLQEACAKRNLGFIALEANSFDYAQDLTAVLETPSLLYRLTTTQAAATLEALLLRPGVTSLYQDEQVPLTRGFPWSAALRLERAGLPIIPTIFNIGVDQASRLEHYAEKLGGFPLVLKATGGSHGASVLRVDSIESLRSVLGFVAGGNQGTFVLRKFIHAATHLRMVVIGDKVADAIRYLPQPGDFRTNAVAVPQVEAYPRPAENEHYFDLAVRAVQALRLEFGGVDLLLDEKGDAFIAEVNFPCNFARNQLNTGADVAGMIVDYLLAKSQAA